MNFTFKYLYIQYSDNNILDSFFYYTNYILKNNYMHFYLEIILILYIIHNIVFYSENKSNYKIFYFKFVFFIFFLFSISILDIIFFDYNIIYSNLLISNKFILSNKCFILFSLVLILLIIKNKILTNVKIVSLNELPIIFSFLILFIFILFSTYDFFLIYLTIEGISLIIYCLGSLMSDSLINLESVIKYFIINNIASSILLWSISYLYILSGTTDSFEVKYIFSSYTESINTHYLQFISITLMLSLLIKLAIFPFHWWIADVFEGLWTPIVLCYAVLIKFTYFILFFKLITNIFCNILFFLSPYLWISAVGSIVIGSLGALTQVKLKRFLAYTSISQSGYILVGFSCNTFNGILSSFIYLIMYCIITLSFFCVLINIEHISKNNNMIYFNQLYSLLIFNKEISFHTIIIIFVMAAIPPFTSFFAKLFIFIVSIEAKLEIITCIILGMSLISTFYYLNFIQQLIFYKLANYKIYYYKENIILNFFLRSNSLFFTFGIFFLINIYEFFLNILLYALYPLSI